MMPLINSSSLDSGKHDDLPLANTRSLEGFIKYLGILASSPESEFASAVLGEIAQKRQEIYSQDEELKKLQQEISHIKKTKETTIEDMFTANEKERARHKASATQIESLRATVLEREIKIAELSRNVESLHKGIEDLKSTCSQEVEKLSQSAKDITTLQNNSKEKDKMIDQMKTAGSKLKSVLSSEQKRNGELEAANTSMSTELQALRARIQRMDDFIVLPSDIDDNFV
jgi:chromosome segregation ATPase